MQNFTTTVQWKNANEKLSIWLTGTKNVRSGFEDNTGLLGQIHTWRN